MFFRTAAKIAARELRATPGRFLFSIAAVAIGVAALTGIKGFGASFKSTLLHNARQLIAADVQGQTWLDPTPEQLARARALAARDGDLTRVTETVSMAGAAGQHTPQLVSVKAVDPAKYPFYGKLTTTPQEPLASLLPDDSSAVVTPETLVRLHTRVGGTIRLGGHDFRITGLLNGEPDRLASGFGPGMRILITRGALDKTGLAGFGSRAAQRFLFKLRPGVNLETFKSQLKNIFPRIFVSDYREGSPVVGQALDTTSTFLALIALIAIIVGSLGVGMAIQSHVEQRMDTLGILKALGGRSNQLLQIYILQTSALGLLGSVIGVVLGFAVQRVFPALVHQFIQSLPPVEVNWSSIPEGVLVGLATTLLFTLPALLSVRAIRPNLVFRRDVSSEKRRFVPAVTGLVMLAGFFLIAVLVSSSWRMGLYFAAGLACAVAVLWAVAAALLFALRRLSAGAGASLPASVRHGVANLHRPGSHARSAVLALGIGVMFTLTTFLLQRAVLHEILAEAPEYGGNLFLLDVHDTSGVTRLVESQPGVDGKLELTGYLMARLVSQNGTPVSQLKLPKRRKEQAETTRLNVSAEQPRTVKVTAGHWWQPNSSSPALAISTEAQRDFHAKVGDDIQFLVAGRTLELPVTAVFERDERSPIRYDLVLPRSAAAGLPVTYFGVVHANPAHIPDIEEAVFDRYPTVTAMNLADIVKRIQEAVDQVTLVVRFLGLFSVAAGVIILASSIAGTRYRRIREIAILKALGATKARIRSIFSIEFCVLGLTAGVIGAVLANGFSRVIATRLLEVGFRFDWLPTVTAIVATALLANVTGWLASARMLNQRPLEVLRNE